MLKNGVRVTDHVMVMFISFVGAEFCSSAGGDGAGFCFCFFGAASAWLDKARKHTTQDHQSDRMPRARVKSRRSK